MKTIYISGISLALFIFAACNHPSKTDKESDKTETVQTDSANADETALTEKQMNAVGIKIGNIEKRDLNSVVRAAGEMALDPQKKADVNTLTGGIIKQILVIEGKPVVKGQTLAYLENTAIVELQKNYLTTKKETLVAEQEYARQTELSTQGAGVEKNLQQAKAGYDILKAQSIGLEKQLRQISINPDQVSAGNMVTQIPIQAPISGTINKIYISMGSYVDIQNPLMSISDNSQIHCDLNVFEKDINQISKGQNVDIALTNQPGISLKGEVYEINKSFNSDMKAILVHVNIKDKKNLKLLPGMYVTALINIGKQNTDAVPNEAIVGSEGKKYIYQLKDVKDENGQKTYHFSRSEIIPGVSEIGYTQITPVTAIAENANIVTSGAFYIASMSAGTDED